MKTFIAGTILVMSFTAFAKPQICTFNYKKEGSTLNWTAFKTPKKVGVKGGFSDFTINTKEAKSVEEVLAAASFEANSQSVDTGDKARDAKIATFFFKKMMKGTKITGKVLKMNGSNAEVEISMNGVTKTVTMKSAVDAESNKATLTGSIDVLEFGMKENLAALTKACFEKHEGVTWPNVDLEFTAALTKNCK